MPTEQSRKSMVFYKSADAPSLDDDGMMTPPAIDRSVYTTYDLAPMADGNRVTVLFKGDGPDGFSLVHSWFGANFQLPRHSHSTDCLYYVLSGEISMGNRLMTAGDGFFIKKDAIYAYIAGHNGAEVLEFRSATSFDMQIADKTPEHWRPIIEAVTANHEDWVRQ